MQAPRTDILFPPGRMVLGNLYKPRDKDAEGKPLVIKNGPDAGKPRVDYFIGLAIPKGAEQHWSQTEWGQKIVAAGAAAFPQAYQSPSFAWKVEDGDSQVPNKRGRKPVDNEGWRGHWVVKLSGGYAPKVYQREGTGYVQVTTEGFVKPGYYVQVSGNVSGNNSANQPGVYVNHSMVLFLGYGPEIVSGPDASAVFGAGPATLPAGASMTPVGVTAMPVTSAPPGLPAAPALAAPPTIAVAPNPGLLAAVLPPPPAPPVIPAAPAAPSITPAGTAAGLTAATLPQWQAAGWTDEVLRRHGYIV